MDDANQSMMFAHWHTSVVIFEDDHAGVVTIHLVRATSTVENDVAGAPSAALIVIARCFGPGGLGVVRNASVVP
jgi:hypothetical protein